MRLLAVLIALAFTAAPAIAAKTLSVATILRDPKAYDGQHVDVSGTVRSIRSKTSARGNDYETFSLCDGSCLHVFAWGRPRAPRWNASDDPRHVCSDKASRRLHVPQRD
jgi:hypothetical protein